MFYLIWAATWHSTLRSVEDHWSSIIQNYSCQGKECVGTSQDLAFPVFSNTNGQVHLNLLPGREGWKKAVKTPLKCTTCPDAQLTYTPNLRMRDFYMIAVLHFAPFHIFLDANLAMSRVGKNCGKKQKNKNKKTVMQVFSQFIYFSQLSSVQLKIWTDLWHYLSEFFLHSSFMERWKEGWITMLFSDNNQS